MKNFHRDDRSGGRGGRDAGRAPMHQTVCSDCGKKCEVPFRPTGDRPVYCNDCFGKHGNAGTSRPGGNRYDRPSYDNKRMFEVVCDKCGKKCEVPFRPTGDKPIYCNECFGKGPSSGGSRGGEMSRDQLSAINAKLDRILLALIPSSAAPALAPAKTAKAVKEVKPKKEKAVATKAKPAAKKAVAKKKK